MSEEEFSLFPCHVQDKVIKRSYIWLSSIFRVISRRFLYQRNDVISTLTMLELLWKVWFNEGWNENHVSFIFDNNGTFYQGFSEGFYSFELRKVYIYSTTPLVTFVGNYSVPLISTTWWNPITEQPSHSKTSANTVVSSLSFIQNREDLRLRMSSRTLKSLSPPLT